MFKNNFLISFIAKSGNSKYFGMYAIVSVHFSVSLIVSKWLPFEYYKKTKFIKKITREMRNFENNL